MMIIDYILTIIIMFNLIIILLGNITFKDRLECLLLIIILTHLILN
jgi:hypothetical protein